MLLPISPRPGSGHGSICFSVSLPWSPNRFQTYGRNRIGIGLPHFIFGTEILRRRSISLFLIPDGLKDIEAAQVSATAYRILPMLTLRFFISLTSYLSVVAAYGPLVSLHYGTFEGATDGNLTKFLGVPFARPA
jgi:hypothetical protein